MSDHDATAATADHAAPDTTGHDDHHDGGTLGPIDWRMWAVGVAGVIAALAVVAGFVVATDFVFLAPGA